VTWTDFHRHDDQSIHLTVISPVFSGQALNKPLGTVIFEIDPNEWLYPYLQEWPTESQTAETLLVRQEGNEVVFLNPTRFNSDAALNLRLPSSQSQVIAVKAILGSRGIVEGLDYRGQPGVSAVYDVADSPWILIARMDKAEIYAPARIRLLQTTVFIIILILALGGGLGLFWRGNRLREYRDKLTSAEALAKSEEKFRKAFNTSPDAVLISRMSDGLIVSTNEGFTKILGYTSEETLGASTIALDIWVNKQDRKKFLSILQEKGSVRDFSAKIRKKNGEFFDGIISAENIEINETPHLLSTTRDVTEQKAAEKLIQEYSSHLEEMVEDRTRELNKAQERLLRQERLAALGQLAGSIAHELRNPLGVISNATAYLSMIQPDADEKVREYIEIIQSETRTSEKIIADLMDYARLQTVERKPADISELIRNAQRRNPAPEHVKVFAEVPSGLPPVLVNATQIEQVIGNLLTNAYQAMPTSGKLLIKVELSGESVDEEWVKLTMKDSGEGIAPEDIERIFEPLFTTKAKGIGLGLAVSKKIIDANQGRVSVESQPGKGSTFTLYLPIHKESK
jgi:PAS domain S-box-containing protein